MQSTTTTSRTLALIIATVLAGAAQAQEQPVAGPESAKGIEEIVVTAQKREENILEVPLSVTVVGQDQLQQPRAACARQQVERRAVRTQPRQRARAGDAVRRSVVPAAGRRAVHPEWPGERHLRLDGAHVLAAGWPERRVPLVD
jgi:hypothetical protein